MSGLHQSCRLGMLLLLTFKLVTCQSGNLTKIVGGSPTTIAKVPYLVNLRIRGEFYCGAALIAPKIVVTAAHCVDEILPRQITVVGGATYLSQRGVRRRAQKIIMPTNYNSKNFNMDIALIKLSKAMRGRNIRSIGLCNSRLPVGGIVRISGWGYTSESGNTSNRVRSVRVPLVSKRNCARKYSDYAKLTSTMICASKAGKDSCSGDSGGPLVYKGRLCGIVSWGIGCARQQYPGVYTNILKARKFLRLAIKA